MGAPRRLPRASGQARFLIPAPPLNQLFCISGLKFSLLCLQHPANCSARPSCESSHTNSGHRLDTMPFWSPAPFLGAIHPAGGSSSAEGSSAEAAAGERAAIRAIRAGVSGALPPQPQPFAWDDMPDLCLSHILSAVRRQGSRKVGIVASRAHRDDQLCFRCCVPARTPAGRP